MSGRTFLLMIGIVISGISGLIIYRYLSGQHIDNLSAKMVRKAFRYKKIPLPETSGWELWRERTSETGELESEEISRITALIIRHYYSPEKLGREEESELRILLKRSCRRLSASSVTRA